MAILALITAPLHAGDAPDFGREVLPILSDHCFACHGPDAKARKANLRLDNKAGAAAVIAGKSTESELFARVASKDPDEVMPPPKSKRPLTGSQVETLRRWIDSGAAWGQHWAFVSPRRGELPKVRDETWPRNGVDRFVLARLERERLAPAPEASREHLLRRVSLDLTGLPPTLAEVDAFLADTSPDAYEKAVDRRLKSPAYGERMAWDWLDAARYADTNGYQGDGERTMWPWRDWVVKAFNDNMPFDRFTVEQLAGDLLPNSTNDQKIATAFNRNHMINGEGGRIPEENRIEYVMDQSETVATVWLGLTMTCARCHDHKFDPITQADYYRLFAFFNRTPVDGSGGNGKAPPVVDFTTSDEVKRRANLNKAFDELLAKVKEKEAKLRDAGKTEKDGRYATTLPQVVEESLRKGPTGRSPETDKDLIAFYKDKELDYVTMLPQLRTRREERDAFNRTLAAVMVMEDSPKPRETFILARGAYDKPGAKVTPGVPAALPPPPSGSDATRLGLARWIVDPSNPLPARVTVNRAWQTFFGAGLVETVEDFGNQGSPPSHPELLDWLATGFVASGWDVKALHRLIVTSASYRQSSRATSTHIDRDPTNRLIARGPRHRLPSWMIRDQALAASGRLVRQVGGRSVKPYQPPGIWEEASFGTIAYSQDHGESLYRRSLYTFWRRIVGPTTFFDVASRQTCTVRAIRTNTPLHALVTMNDPTFVESARVLAEKSLTGPYPTDAARVSFLFRQATARRPTPEETAILLRNLDRLRTLYTADPKAAARLVAIGEAPRNTKLDVIEHAAYTGLGSLVLNLDETLSKP